MIVSPKYGKAGRVTSYTLNIGCNEARACGFIDDNGDRFPIKKTIDAENNRIIFELDLKGEQTTCDPQ